MRSHVATATSHANLCRISRHPRGVHLTCNEVALSHDGSAVHLTASHCDAYLACNEVALSLDGSAVYLTASHCDAYLACNEVAPSHDGSAR